MYAFYRVASGQYYGHFFLDNNLLVNAGDMMNRVGDDEKDAGNEKEKGNVRTKWIRVQRDLENESHRNDRLYHAFLPRPLAVSIRKGEIPGAGDIFNITCSRIYQYVKQYSYCSCSLLSKDRLPDVVYSKHLYSQREPDNSF